MTTEVKITPANHEIEVTIVEGTSPAFRQVLLRNGAPVSFWVYPPRVITIREIVSPAATVVADEGVKS